ncbi:MULTISPECIES: hypothetical protein [unclassified Novosphingobium]|uniref:hypothetical protein n=1 Tax=unclassified Novosphingobium TaxID=2644732 RepID=UPI001448844C|nr:MULTISPECIES: hypothetical protein [unclassified Novosphingobium]NKJ42028.1 hypothetical protein [Novosphingobium sp. SG720]NMN04417.1 hypothetical protein [Novosphingobium sp. SG919]NMN85592.1 hypothetical protein [Novosphingobium sp. SG916]
MQAEPVMHPMTESQPPPADGALTAPLRLRLADILHGLDDHFTRIGTTLERTVEAISAVVGTLGQISAALGASDGTGAVGNLTRAAKRLYRVAEQANRRAEQVGHIRAVSARLTAQIHDLQRTLEALKIYGMNVKIAAGGARDFVDFADLMAQKLDMGKADAAGFDGRLAELERGVASMLRSDSRLVSECARVVPQVPDRLIRDAEALQTHQDSLAAMARTTGEIAATIQTKVAAVLGAIQIGDIARQRLEHVLAGCEMLDAHLGGRAPANPAEEAACHHLLALLHAQLEETAIDFRRETLVLVDSLHDLEPEANRLLALQAPHEQPAQGEGAEEDGRTAREAAFLRELEGGIAEATAMIGQLQEADAQAEQTLELIITTVEDLMARAAMIRHLRVDVQLMAINIGLSCRRVEAIGRPMTVIANEIRSHAETLDGAVTHINAAASDLSNCSAAMRGTDRSGETGTGDELAQSLAMIRQGAQRTEQAIAVAGKQSDTIATMLRKTRDELEVSLDLAKTIEVIAVRTADLAGTGGRQDAGAHAAIAGLMGALGQIYTMASERVVHDRFLLEGMAPLTSSEPAQGFGPSGGDDDDALFDDALF